MKDTEMKVNIIGDLVPGEWYHVTDSDCDNPWMFSKVDIFVRVDSFDDEFVTFTESVQDFVYVPKTMMISSFAMPTNIFFRTPHRQFFNVSITQRTLIRNSMNSEPFNI